MRPNPIRDCIREQSDTYLMNRRTLQVIFGIGGVIAGLAMLIDGNFVGVPLIAGSGWVLARQFEETRNNRERERQAEMAYERWQNDRRSRGERYNDNRDADRTDVPQIYPHAIRAVANAGHQTKDMPVLPVDIGVLAHRGDEPPRLYRTRDVPNDVDYVQPYIQLRIPSRAKGTITFELQDDHGELVFYREEEHKLEQGLNLIVPGRRLPVHDALDMDEGEWTLRVSAEGSLLAVHGFGWREETESIVTGHLTDDGEISTELRAAMAETRLESMSLDDLLSFQNEDPAPQQRSRSARG